MDCEFALFAVRFCGGEFVRFAVGLLDFPNLRRLRFALDSPFSEQVRIEDHVLLPVERVHGRKACAQQRGSDGHRNQESHFHGWSFRWLLRVDVRPAINPDRVSGARLERVAWVMIHRQTGKN